MEDIGIKPGDWVIIKDGPKIREEWVNPIGIFEVTRVTTHSDAGDRIYVYIKEHDYNYNRAFDARRCINVNRLSKLEKALYE